MSMSCTFYTFIDDEDASQYLTRPKYRKPWLLPAIAELY
jgi:hypothetical protein